MANVQQLLERSLARVEARIQAGERSPQDIVAAIWQGFGVSEKLMLKDYPGGAQGFVEYLVDHAADTIAALPGGGFVSGETEVLVNRLTAALREYWPIVAVLFGFMIIFALWRKS